MTTAGQRVGAEHYYDAIESDYAAEVKRRRAYLDAVDDIVLDRARQAGSRHMLDVGCATGLRSKAIAARLEASLVGLDISSHMVSAARRNGVDAYAIDIVSPGDRGSLPRSRYDLVISLWNVLGHVESARDRAAALANMRSFLDVGGSAVIDVNNRHNASAYGWAGVLRNRVAEMRGSNELGDFIIGRAVGDHEVETRVHLFSADEIIGLCRDAALEPVAVHYVDYATGAIRRRSHQGQICIVAEAT